MSDQMRLTMNTINKAVNVTQFSEEEPYYGLTPSFNQDITEDFKRCVVRYCTEVIEFEVDGLRFRATCECLGDVNIKEED